MLAARFHATGGPSVLRVDEVPAPREPRGDELLVRVAASSINGTDLGLRRGDVPLAAIGRLPFIPGFDLAGQVVRCGPAVTAFAPGDHVIALLGHRGGGQAEQLLLRQSRAALAPRTVLADAAASLPLAGLTALQALHGHAGLHVLAGEGRPVPRVLVIGASGGIGSYAVQLAKLTGAHVTGVASGPKLGHVTGLGADLVVDHREHDVTALGERWDVVLDVPGRLSFRAVRPILTGDGVHVSTRPVGPDALRTLAPARLRAGRPRFAFVATRARSQDLARLANLVDRGSLRPPVDRTYPLAEIAQAHQHAENGVLGKVVVTL